MKKRLLLLLGICCSWSLLAQLNISTNSKTSYKIVLPPNASSNLRYAAFELKLHLEEATKAKFPIVNEPINSTKKQIVLEENVPQLKNGEFHLKILNNSLLLLGGGSSGIHHAVHDFLESDCGYIWYDAKGGKKVPNLTNFKLGRLDCKKSYAIEARSLTPDWFFYRPEGHYFLYRNGMNVKTRLYPLPQMDKKFFNFNKNGILTGFGVNDIRRASPSDHTFFDYIPDVPGKSRISAFKKLGYFKSNPEFFSMSITKKRIVRQLCFSNPKLKEEFKKNFYIHIKSTPSMNVFSVTAFDFPGLLCYCQSCQTSVKKHKANGAPLFLFIKELALSVAKDFPNVKIMQFAYRKEQTEIPPIGINFPDNVILAFCPIDDDLSKDWQHKNNKATFENLKKWRQICKNVWVWYYVNPWTFGTISTPLVGNVYRCANDIIAACNAQVNGFLFSHQVGLAPMTGFTELQSYLIARLIRNPKLDVNFLIDDFFKFRYGKAAPIMKQFLTELEAVTNKTDVFVKWNAVYGVWNSYIKGDKISQWQNYFDQMDKLTSNNPQMNFSIKQVRIPLDMMTLRFYGRIKKEVPNFKVSADLLAKRIKDTGFKAIDSFYSIKEPQIKTHAKKHKDLYERLVNNMYIQENSKPKALPKEIFGSTNKALIFEFFPEAMRKSYIVKDQLAAWDYTLLNTEAPQNLPIQFLAYDETKNLWKIFGEIKNVKPNSEGKYQFYHAGKILISPSLELRVLFKGYKNLVKILPGEVWMPGTDDTINVYVSIKLTGPNYYKNSKEKNSVSIDRIVIVRKSNE